MKSAILALSFAAGIAFAQDDLSGGVPKCAGPCVQQYTTGGKIAGCAILEIKCVCENKDFLSGIACCLESACDEAGKDAAVKYAGQICDTVGVDVPDKVECSTGASSAATTSSMAASKASTGSASETASSTTGSSAASTGSAASATGSSASTTTEESATGTEAEASTSAPTTGAAAILDPAGGLVGAAVAIIFAL